MKILKWIKEQVYYRQINWELLLFLILFLEVKLWVKLLSVIITCAMLGKIIIETGAINPYTYQGLYQKYLYVKKDKKEDSIISSNREGRRIPGKVLALQQTYHFFQRYPLKILTGNGSF